jgi:two-component system, NtrC family, response regulator HydG
MADQTSGAEIQDGGRASVDLERHEPVMRHSLGPTRVLIVDDRLEMAEMIADGLGDRGYETLALSSGRDALSVLSAQRVDVVVTDLRMPDIDGFELLQAAIELDPSCTVIVMTAYGTLDTALEATRRGAFHYLTKPFRLDALVRVLEQAR